MKRKSPDVGFWITGSGLYLAMVFLFDFLPRYSGNIRLIPEALHAIDICTILPLYLADRILVPACGLALGYRLTPLTCAFLLLVAAGITKVMARQRILTGFAAGAFTMILLFHSSWAACYLAISQSRLENNPGGTVRLTFKGLNEIAVIPNGNSSVSAVSDKPDRSQSKKRPVGSPSSDTHESWVFNRFEYDGLKNLLLFALTAWFAGCTLRGWQRVLGLSRALAVPWTTLIQAVFLGLLAGIILGFSRIFFAVGHGYNSPSTWWYGFLFVFSITGALFEEVLFRNLLLGALLRRIPFSAANIIQTLLFSLWHIHQDDFRYHTDLCILGYLFGAVWYRAGILAALITHLTGNYTSMFISASCGSLTFGW